MERSFYPPKPAGQQFPNYGNPQPWNFDEYMRMMPPFSQQEFGPPVFHPGLHQQNQNVYPNNFGPDFCPPPPRPRMSLNLPAQNFNNFRLGPFGPRRYWHRQVIQVGSPSFPSIRQRMPGNSETEFRTAAASNIVQNRFGSEFQVPLNPSHSFHSENDMNMVGDEDEMDKKILTIRTGTISYISKDFGNFGFIDSDVIFSLSALEEGLNPTVGQRVIFQAEAVRGDISIKWKCQKVWEQGNRTNTPVENPTIPSHNCGQDSSTNGNNTLHAGDELKVKEENTKITSNGLTDEELLNKRESKRKQRKSEVKANTGESQIPSKKIKMKPESETHINLIESLSPNPGIPSESEGPNGIKVSESELKVQQSVTFISKLMEDKTTDVSQIVDIEARSNTDPESISESANIEGQASHQKTIPDLDSISKANSIPRQKLTEALESASRLKSPKSLLEQNRPNQRSEAVSRFHLPSHPTQRKIPSPRRPRTPESRSRHSRKRSKSPRGKHQQRCLEQYSEKSKNFEKSSFRDFSKGESVSERKLQRRSVTLTKREIPSLFSEKVHRNPIHPRQDVKSGQCGVCLKFGHHESVCWFRPCSSCQVTGHHENDCLNGHCPIHKKKGHVDKNCWYCK